MIGRPPSEAAVKRRRQIIATLELHKGQWVKPSVLTDLKLTPNPPDIYFDVMALIKAGTVERKVDFTITEKTKRYVYRLKSEGQTQDDDNPTGFAYFMPGRNEEDAR